MLLFLVVLVAAASPADRVVGSWVMPGMSVPFAVFKADGSCSIGGMPCTWRGDAKVLFVTSDDGSGGETEAVPYKSGKGALTLTLGGGVLDLVPVGAVPPAAKPATIPAGTAGTATATTSSAAKVDVNDAMAKLLLSTAWCSFHYNQTTGYSSTTRVQWFPDGTYQIGGRSEGYSSGSGGTFASQHDSGTTGRWTVQKGVVMATPPPSPENPAPTAMVVVPMVVSKNSNGYPIVTTLGVEYSQCQ